MQRENILMVGTARDGAGGIASVISAYAEHGLFARWPIVTLDSHVGGSRWRKLGAFVGAFLRFGLMLVKRQFGLLHLHTSADASFWRKACFASCAFLFRRPVLLHLHSGQFMTFYENHCGPLRRQLVRRVLEHSERVIALSPAWRDWVRSVAPRAQVVCIANPVIMHGGQPRQLRRRVVLFLGKLCAEKGVYDLITAWQPIHHQMPDARLVLAGDGEIDAARKHVAALGLADSVEVPGWVSGAAKQELLARAEICVLPSYFEGMPVSLLEALGSGMPCVATTVGGIPGLMQEGVQGRLVKPGDIAALSDALMQVLSSEVRYAEMSRAALARFVADYSADVVMAKLEALYAEVGMRPLSRDDAAISQAKHGAGHTERAPLQ